AHTLLGIEFDGVVDLLGCRRRVLEDLEQLVFADEVRVVEVDWMEKAISVSPFSCTGPTDSMRLRPNQSGSASVSVGMQSATSPRSQAAGLSAPARRVVSLCPSALLIHRVLIRDYQRIRRSLGHASKAVKAPLRAGEPRREGTVAEGLDPTPR